MEKILCLLLLSLVSVHGQMSTTILRDIINPDPTRRDQLLEGLGVPSLDEVPYLGSSTRYLTNQSFFEFILEEEGTQSPHFRISAVELSSLTGEEDCQQTAGDLSVITQLEVEIGTATGSSAVNVSSYLAGDFLDLNRLGLGPENDAIRFSIPPLAGDEVTFQTEENSTFCLQVEFIGIQLGTQDPPPPPRNLLQYNMRSPDFSYTRTQVYDDIGYTGMRGVLYTGGTGSLTDGRVGTEPVGFPEEWVGNIESTGLRVFFNREYPVSQISVYFWSDLVNGATAPTGGARDKSGNRMTEFQFVTEVYDVTVPELQIYTAFADAPVMLDFIEMPLRTSGQSLLVTEVSVLQDRNGELVDISTELIADEIQLVPEISLLTTQPPLPDFSEIIIYASAGMIVCLFFTIGCMCLMFVAIFCCMRDRVKKDIIRANTHPSLIRQLSDKYVNPSGKPPYDQFQQPDQTYSEIDNVYQELETHVTLPLPPIPTEESTNNKFLKEDSYIEMQATPEARQNSKSCQMSQLRDMRTFSEDDYVPVTPPHTCGPNRQISDPYVAVTPPEDDRVFNLTQIEETYETVEPPEAEYNMENVTRHSFPNAYVTMATKDTPM